MPLKSTTFPNEIWWKPFISRGKQISSNFLSDKKEVSSFPLLDKWNGNNSLEEMKVYFSIVLDDEV